MILILKTAAVSLEMSTKFLALAEMLLDLNFEFDDSRRKYPLANKKQQAAKREGKRSEVAEKAGTIDSVTPIS